MQHFPAEACTPFRNKQISNPEGKSGIGTLSEIAIWHKNLSTIKSWRNTKTALVQIPAAIVTKNSREDGYQLLQQLSPRCPWARLVKEEFTP